MTEAIVRRLGKEDTALAAAVVSKFLSEEPCSRDYLPEMLDDQRNIVIAAVVGTRPIGFLVAYQVQALDGKNLVYLYDIEVDENSRRLGLGRRMVRLLKEVAAAQGVESIWVGSSHSRTAACRLWEATGATRVSTQFIEYVFGLPDR